MHIKTILANNAAIISYNLANPPKWCFDYYLSMDQIFQHESDCVLFTQILVIVQFYYTGTEVQNARTNRKNKILKKPQQTKKYIIEGSRQLLKHHNQYKQK